MSPGTQIQALMLARFNYFTNSLSSLHKKFGRFLMIRIYFLSIRQIFFTIVNLAQEVLLCG